MTRTILYLFFQCLVFTAFAQIDEEPLPVDEQGKIQIRAGNRVVGKVVQMNNDRPLPVASVQLFVVVSGQGVPSRDSLIRAMLTKQNGDFRFENIPPAKELKIMVSAVGYSNYQNTFPFYEGQQGDIQQDLGNIALAQEAKTLEGVVVVAERPAMRLGIDKQVFDVSKTLTAKGGTAADVMQNIPSVNVDVEGNVELRNASPTIFVDGRPTILTLDQIPGESIDRVEIITNPSAKYDASSSGGIINIVLKENKRQGLNGIVSATAGSDGILGLNANVNIRQGKVNFFVTGSHNEGNGEAKGSSFRANKREGVVTDYFYQNSVNSRRRNFNSVRFGADYFIDNRNTLSISQGMVNGRFRNRENQAQEYLAQNRELMRYGQRESHNQFEFNRSNTDLNFTHKFPKEGKELTLGATYNWGDAAENTGIQNRFFNPDHSLGEIQIVQNDGQNDNHQLTVKADFVNPFGENRKLETGVRSYINNYENEFNSYAVEGELKTKLPLSNRYRYQEEVHAAYITYTGMLGSIGYQAGLRGEYSKFTGDLIDSARSFGYEYPGNIEDIWDALFPSLYLSKKITEDDEVQLNYSRRVRRPNFWHLNPFIDINDPMNIQQGNPELKPEFQNSLEMNYSKNLGAGSNLLTSVYWRNTQGDITRYSDTLTASQYEQLNNAAVDPNAILNTFINSSSSNRGGLEVIWQQKLGPNFDITPSVSVSYRKVSAGVNDIDLSNEGFDWEGELTANYRIVTKNDRSFFNKLSFQLNGEYNSPRVLPQGKRLENWEVDFAFKKDFLKNDRMSFTFSVDDLFDTDIHGVVYDTERFYQESFRRRRVRSFRVSLSYRFGDAEFTLFRRGEGSGGGNDQF